MLSVRMKKSRATRQHRSFRKVAALNIQRHGPSNMYHGSVPCKTIKTTSLLVVRMILNLNGHHMCF
jgi:hypothetical protein